jgi:hypothetical protein
MNHSSNFKKEKKTTEHSSTHTHEINGKINEASVLPSLSNDKNLILNLEKVESINSIGVKTWMNWLKELEKCESYTFSKVPRILIDQCNMIKDFIPSNKITSFEVPYFCDSCETQNRVFLEVVNRRHPLVETSVPCKTCGKSCEMDVIPNSYFKFLGSI